MDEIILKGNDDCFDGIRVQIDAVKHKNHYSVNKTTDSQGFFIKLIVCFSFINIFAFC